MTHLIQRSEAETPLLLVLVDLFVLVVLLTATWPLLPAEIKQAASWLPGLQAQALNPLHESVRQASALRLERVLGYLLTQPSFLAWLCGAVAMATISTGLVHLRLSGGGTPAWRFWAGAAVWLVMTWLGWYSLGRMGQPLLGVVGGFVAGRLLGWWVVDGGARPVPRLTDARTVRAALSFAKPFQPERYFDLKRGVFMGLGADGRPVYIDVADARKHLQVIGETRTGKTVSATVLLAQCALMKETVLVLDPKADKHAPRVFRAIADRAGVPFVYIDLRPDQPAQLSPLSGASPSEVEELLISCFDLSSKGSDADVYRVEDRAAARKLARSGAQSFTEMVAIGASDESITDARKFWEDLQELAAHPVIQTRAGWRLEEWVGRPAVLYIAGSTRHDNTVRLQKLVLLRLLQLIDRHGAAEGASWSALFLDEFKYLLSPGALRALGTIADRNCHLLIAHQSLGDLRDVAGLDPGAVYGAVVVNTGLKLFYKTNDPDTATWGAKLSGQIRTVKESLSKRPAAASPGSYQEQTRPLIDENMLLALPKLTGMLYGAGVAKLVCVHPLAKAAEQPQPVAAPLEEVEQSAEGPI